MRVAVYAAEESSFNEIDSGELSNVNAVSCSAVRSILVKSRACYYVWLAFNNSFLEYHFDEHKRKEYRSYARLFAYEDLDFPYRKEAKAFNLDNPTDLNVFLDFLTDNYPTAITYPREEYFTNKLAKEYLKVIYQ